MIANYHTHTWRCNHASGSEREYVDNALKAGLRTLGFSDHSPYVFPAGYYSHFRMKMDQLEDYVRCVLDLRREYAGRMEIPLGLELEFYPKFFPELMSILRDYPLDYLLLGQHFVGNEIDSHYSGHTTRGDAVLEQYRELTIAAEAGQQKLDTETSADPELRDRFAKRLHDLKLSRMVSMQMLAQIRILLDCNTALEEKIQSLLTNTLALWKNQTALALAVKDSAQAMEDLRKANGTMIGVLEGVCTAENTALEEAGTLEDLIGNAEIVS